MAVADGVGAVVDGEPVEVDVGDFFTSGVVVSLGLEPAVPVAVGPITGVGGTGTRAVGARWPASGVAVAVGSA